MHNNCNYQKRIQYNIDGRGDGIGDLTMIKIVSKEYAEIGEILTYTIDITNTGTLLVSNVIFRDIIPAGATFISGSVRVNGTSHPSYDPNAGFNIGSMIVLSTNRIVFDVLVTSLPSPNTIINKATTRYNYLIIVPIEGTSESNEVITTIQVKDLIINKTTDRSAVRVGDTLTYEIILENTGNISLSNIVFLDQLDPKVLFIPGSVKVNGVSQPTYDPIIGFVIAVIDPGNSVLIAFDSVVVG